MKFRLQLNPALAGATACALLWFAAWLIPFRPAAQRNRIPPTRPPVCLWPGGAETIREIQSPSRFALPSEQGFSGTFPAARINLLVPSDGAEMQTRINPPNNPAQEKSYLPRDPIARTQPDTLSLLEKIPRLITDLPMPTMRPTPTIAQPPRIALFLSPELQARSEEPLQLSVSGELPTSVRIHLGIRPDGTVDQALFETPVQNDALAGAVRQLRFRPATARTEGWLELRFTPGGET